MLLDAHVLQSRRAQIGRGRDDALRHGLSPSARHPKQHRREKSRQALRFPLPCAWRASLGHCFLPFFAGGLVTLLISALWAAWLTTFTSEGGTAPTFGVVGKPRCATSSMARLIGMRTSPACRSTQP